MRESRRLLVFGADSLVGSHLLEHPPPAWRLQTAGRNDPSDLGLRVDSFQPADLEDLEAVPRLIAKIAPAAVVNFAARTDVDAIETERPRQGSSPPSGNAFTVNALAPERMARAAAQRGIPFVSLSTDFVFDGTTGLYEERALDAVDPSAISWYGWTKAEGERRIREAHPDATVLRISYPYRSRFSRKGDFARNLLARARAGTLPPLYTDQLLTPTWIPDVTKAICSILDEPLAGPVHVASPETTTPYEFAQELIERFGVTSGPPKRGRLSEVLNDPGAVRRPLRGGLRCQRLRERGLPLTGWREGIAQMALELGSEKAAG